MRLLQNTLTFVAAMMALSAFTPTVHAAQSPVQLGPRPFYLVDQLKDGELKNKLVACIANTRRYRHHDFSIGHRGAALQFPEHTKEAYEAGRRMGAGILECDVTFTSDGELVYRHAQCDLHTTTNILATDLASTCRVPFTPAEFDTNGQRVKAAAALCCTTDLTLAEFKTLKGKMDASNPNASSVEEFLTGTAGFRTDLYAIGGTLLSHQESIALIDGLGAKFTVERSGRIVEDVLEGGNTFYYRTTLDSLRSDGDILRTIDVLAQDVGIIGLFSDWPATTTFYANCLK